VLDPPGTDSVSLAHDGGAIAAAYGRAPVGIDLLAIDRLTQAERVVRARLARGARGLVGGNPTGWPDAALLWTAWEAAGKRSGRGVLSGPMERGWTLARDEAYWGASDGDVRVRWLEEAGCLLCLATALGTDRGAR
jgi:hypothetical protein